ncbi:6-bladed beta-propeller, partial [candidate division KSB1 bacterium]
RIFTVLIMTPLIFMSCDTQDATYTVEVIDGVRHVHNLAPLWGDEQRVTLEFVQKIGELEGEDENYQFYRPAWIAKDSAGNIYVLDTGNCRIQVFNENGGYLRTIGRQGQGPGEFENPDYVYFDSEGNLYVAEPMNAKVVVLSPDDKESRRIRLDHTHDFVRIMHSGRFVMPVDAFKRLYSPELPEETNLASLLETDGSLLKDFGRLHDFGDESITNLANSFDVAFDRGDNIYLVMSYLNRIEKYTPDAEMIFRADRPLNFEPTYDLRYLQIEMFGRMNRVAQRNFTRVSRGIAVDSHDRVWIMTYLKDSRQVDDDEDPSDYMEFQLFDTEGVWLGRIPAPHEGIPVIIGDRLFIVDTEGEMCVYEYRIVENLSIQY